MPTYFLMDGYAFYIWSAYGITTIILGVVWVLSNQMLKTTKAKLSELQSTQSMKTGIRPNEKET